jgi:hypothetical protein
VTHAHEVNVSLYKDIQFASSKIVAFEIHFIDVVVVIFNGTIINSIADRIEMTHILFKLLFFVMLPK